MSISVFFKGALLADESRMGIAPFDVSQALTEGERVVREKA
jgi:hypothetical protein